MKLDLHPHLFLLYLQKMKLHCGLVYNLSNDINSAYNEFLAQGEQEEPALATYEKALAPVNTLSLSLQRL